MARWNPVPMMKMRSLQSQIYLPRDWLTHIFCSKQSLRLDDRWLHPSAVLDQQPTTSACVQAILFHLTLISDHLNH